MSPSSKKILSKQEAAPLKGRGASDNPANRFEVLAYQEDDSEDTGGDSPRVATVYYADHSRSILNYNDSPDVGFDAGVNPYRGCEHGCIYCYARPTHEYLGFSAGLDFESRIMVKLEAPELLRRELSSKKWQPQVVAMSGVTDCYQPAERRFQLTRRCLEVFAEFRNPVVVITKNHLVTRDVDVLKRLATHRAVRVYLSITTLDSKLARILEPRASTPEDRLSAVKLLSREGIPVGVMVAPVIPAINDTEIPAILQRVAEAGALGAGYVMLRLPYGVAPLFSRWLEQHFPERKTKVLNRIRAMRDGKLNTAEFGERMRGKGIFVEQIGRMFKLASRKAGLTGEFPPLSTRGFQRPQGNQLALSFDSKEP